MKLGNSSLPAPFKEGQDLKPQQEQQIVSTMIDTREITNTFCCHSKLIYIMQQPC